jgi:hypothetical protein
VPRSHNFRASPELERLQALVESFDGSSPSPDEIEKALESGLAKLMLLEGRVREQTSRASMTRPSRQACEDDDLDAEIHVLRGEIRALREAVAELRARTDAASTPLARGFVLRRER